MQKTIDELAKSHNMICAILRLSALEFIADYELASAISECADDLEHRDYSAQFQSYEQMRKDLMSANQRLADAATQLQNENARLRAEVINLSHLNNAFPETRTAQRSDEETERAAFEKCWESATKDWAWPMGANKFRRNPDNPNEYAHSWTRSAWLAWQLRAETFDLSK